VCGLVTKKVACALSNEDKDYLPSMNWKFYCLLHYIGEIKIKIKGVTKSL
jgi:hypothetical protein